jgi:predicted MFS family arabinose efflux permease
LIWAHNSAGHHPEERSVNLRSQLRAVRKTPSLLTFIGFGAAFGFAASFLGPFFSVFLYEGLGVSVAQVSRIVVVSGITGAVSLPAWGQLYDRYGCRPVMMFVLFPWMLTGSFWSAVGPDNTWILFIIYGSGGLFGVGFLLGSFNLLLKLIPREAKTIAISLNVALASLAAAIAPILGGSLLDLAWDLGFDMVRTYHAAAIVHYGLLLSTVLILSRVVEPKSSSVSQVIGAMRSYRQIGSLLGLSFLLNYTFVKKNRKRGNESRTAVGSEGKDASQ